MIINDFQVFYKAAEAWLNGASPYSVYGFWNPVWGVLPFLPLTLLPITVAQWVWVVATLLGAMLALARFKVPPLRVAAFVLLSPFCLLNFHFANVDWLVLLGATLPPHVGIWLVALKPQTGFVVIIGWTLRIWRKDGWRGVAKLLLPISSVVVIQLVTIGFGMPDAKATASNFSLLPWGIPFGVLMLIKYVREGETADGLIAAFCLTPYLSLPSWLTAVPWAGQSTKRTVFAIVAAWGALLFWQISTGLYANTIIGWLSLIAAGWLGWKMLRPAAPTHHPIGG